MAGAVGRHKTSGCSVPTPSRFFTLQTKGSSLCRRPPSRELASMLPPLQAETAHDCQVAAAAQNHALRTAWLPCHTIYQSDCSSNATPKPPAPPLRYGAVAALALARRLGPLALPRLPSPTVSQWSPAAGTCPAARRGLRRHAPCGASAQWAAGAMAQAQLLLTVRLTTWLCCRACIQQCIRGASADLGNEVLPSVMCSAGVLVGNAQPYFDRTCGSRAFGLVYLLHYVQTLTERIMGAKACEIPPEGR